MAERKLFGTDGIRGKSNTFPMTPELALKLGIATGALFKKGNYRHKVIIGKDTRLSGYMIENALASGFSAVGMDVTMLGPLPTPAVAMLTRNLRVDLGVMISASHNPYEDNGIKLFAPSGYKLSDETEAEIEKYIEGDLTKFLSAPEDVGRISRLESAKGRYIEYVKSSFPKNLKLNGLKIVVDCANGAAYKAAPSILWELGAEIIPLSIEPNGKNINRACGALFPTRMCAEVVAKGADIGIALDGDADRVIISDERGNVIDGDQIIGLIAKEWQKKGMLKNNTVVTTVMSNLGLELFLKDEQISLVRAKVGDRYVVEEMLKNDYNLGGEQSGHIILGEFATTGDGMMAALQVLEAMVREGKKASQILDVFKPLPQVLKNVRFETREQAKNVLEKEEVKSAISEAESKLKEQGRLLIRTSGTEPLIRVMAEGQSTKAINEIVDGLCKIMEQKQL